MFTLATRLLLDLCRLVAIALPYSRAKVTCNSNTTFTAESVNSNTQRRQFRIDSSAFRAGYNIQKPRNL